MFLTDLLKEVKTLIETLPPGTLAAPFDTFPLGVTVRRGWYPSTAKAVSETPTIWITPALDDAVTFDDEDDDRCGTGSTKYSIYIGIVQRLTTVETGDIAEDEEVTNLSQLSEDLMTAFKSLETASGYRPDGVPELQVFIEPALAEKRIFASWWKVNY